MLKCTNAQMLNCTNVQMGKSQMNNCTTALRDDLDFDFDFDFDFDLNLNFDCRLGFCFGVRGRFFVVEFSCARSLHFVSCACAGLGRVPNGQLHSQCGVPGYVHRLVRMRQQVALGVAAATLRCGRSNNRRCIQV